VEGVGGLEKGGYFSIKSFWGVYIVGYLDKFFDVSLFADDEVDFFASAGRFVVVDVIEERGTAAEEFDAYDILKTIAVVLRQKGVGSVSDKAGFAKY
jgi:hypothetical protein